MNCSAKPASLLAVGPDVAVITAVPGPSAAAPVFVRTRTWFIITDRYCQLHAKIYYGSGQMFFVHH